eukprot:gene7215-7428_t
MLASHTTTLHRPKAFSSSSSSSRRSLVVTNAITRQKKEEIVKVLEGKLDNSVIVFGLRVKGLNVQKVQNFRRGVPENSTVYMCKNSLMKAAIKNRPDWSTLAEQGCTGDNTWVFVHEDDIPEAVKHWNKFYDELEKEAKAAAPKGFKRCENLPTKKQLQATIARLLKQPATKIASGIKAVPRKLAYGIKAISELDEDKTKIVGDVAKPKSETDSA